mgnify:CR=1 FL=1
MPRPRHRLLTIAATALATTVALAAPASADDPEVTLPPIPAIKGLPIPSLPTDLLVPGFTGAEATPRPLPAPSVIWPVTWPPTTG